MDPSPDLVGAAERPSTRTALFVNVQARSGAEALPQLQRALSERGVKLEGARAVRRPERFRVRLQQAYAEGVRTFIVGGGDGTISSAARALAGTGATLGVIPLGTGNDFARSLGLPFTLAEACDVIRRGHMLSIDVGVANGRPFLNAATVGLSSEITRRLSTTRLKKAAGRLAYPLAAAQSSLDPHPFRVHLTADGGPARSLDVLQVVVGNGRFHGGGAIISRGARLDDHRLHVYAITAERNEGGAAEVLRNFSSLARVALHMRRGTQDELEDVVSFDAESLTLVADPPHVADVDGELLGMTPVEFRVWPGALRVLVPEAAVG